MQSWQMEHLGPSHLYVWFLSLVLQASDFYLWLFLIFVPGSVWPSVGPIELAGFTTCPSVAKILKLDLKEFLCNQIASPQSQTMPDALRERTWAGE